MSAARSQAAGSVLAAGWVAAAVAGAGGGVRGGRGFCGVHEDRAASPTAPTASRSERQRAQLETRWGQLLLGRSTWGSYARVERLAREELGMKLPATDERVLIRP